MKFVAQSPPVPGAWAEVAEAFAVPPAVTLAGLPLTVAVTTVATIGAVLTVRGAVMV